MLNPWRRQSPLAAGATGKIFELHPKRLVIEQLPRHKRTKFLREVRALRVAQYGLNVLLERTAYFQQDLFTHAESLQPFPEQRLVVAFQSGMLAIEHSDSILRLLISGFHTSAFALVRPQFESLLRGVWLMYAATDEWVLTLSQPISPQTAANDADAPMVGEMLIELKSRAPAHAALIAQLDDFQRQGNKALSNYTHGGLHALSRSAEGFPPQLVFNVLRISNAVTLLTGQMLTILSGNPAHMANWRRLSTAHADCFPIVTGQARA